MYFHDFSRVLVSFKRCVFINSRLKMTLVVNESSTKYSMALFESSLFVLRNSAGRRMIKSLKDFGKW